MNINLLNEVTEHFAYYLNVTHTLSTYPHFSIISFAKKHLTCHWG